MDMIIYFFYYTQKKKKKKRYDHILLLTCYSYWLLGTRRLIYYYQYFHKYHQIRSWIMITHLIGLGPYLLLLPNDECNYLLEFLSHAHFIDQGFSLTLFVDPYPKSLYFLGYRLFVCWPFLLYGNLFFHANEIYEP